jgi:hypothetical protein
MAVLHTALLVSIGVFVASVSVGAAAVAARALTLLRTFRRFDRRIGVGMTQTTVKIAEAEWRIARLETGVAEIERARARLEAALAYALVLVRAANEAARFVARVRALVPSK